MYIDDTTSSQSSKNIVDLSENLNRDLCNLKHWLPGNKLSLNLIKTQAMALGSQDDLRQKGKYLGVPLDRNLV